MFDDIYSTNSRSLCLNDTVIVKPTCVSLWIIQRRRQWKGGHPTSRQSTSLIITSYSLSCIFHFTVRISKEPAIMSSLIIKFAHFLQEINPVASALLLAPIVLVMVFIVGQVQLLVSIISAFSVTTKREGKPRSLRPAIERPHHKKELHQDQYTAEHFFHLLSSFDVPQKCPTSASFSQGTQNQHPMQTQSQTQNH